MSESFKEADLTEGHSKPISSGSPAPTQASMDATPLSIDDSQATALLVRLRQRDKPLLASGEPAHGPG